MARYSHIAAFKANMHHIHLKEKLDPHKKWLPLPYQVEYEDIKKEISEWGESWRQSTQGSSIHATTVPNTTMPTMTPVTVPVRGIWNKKDKHVAGTTPG